MGRRIIVGTAALAAFVAASLLMLHPTMRDARASLPGDNGRIAFSVQSGAPGGGWSETLWIVNPDGTGRTQLTDNPAYQVDEAPSWSPDGTRIAYEHKDQDGQGPDSYVRVINADGTEETPLANGYDPTWSPDGTKIAFTRYRSNAGYVIYVMNADGSEQTKLTRGTDPAWSPDGTRIAFGGCREGFGIFVLRLSDGRVERLTKPSNGCTGYNIEDRTPDWSPDGSKLVFARDRYRNPDEIFTVNADGTGLDRVPASDPGGLSEPAWSPDGQKIVYYDESSFHTGNDGTKGIYTMNPDGTGQTAVVTGVLSYGPNWGVAPGAVPLPPPPTTTVTSGPEMDSEIASRTATFEFASDGEGSTFDCSLDNGPYEDCSSPKTFTRLAEGGHVFRVRATDASGRLDVTPVRRTWTVDTPRNGPPEARYDSFSTRRGARLSVPRPGVLKNDRDPEGGVLTGRAVSRPDHGRLSFRSDGSFVYRPDSGYHGRDGFRYRASDGDGGSATAWVRIDVSKW